MCLCVPSGISTTAREKEAAGGLLLSAAGQRDAGTEVCLHPEGADPAGATSGRDTVGGEWRGQVRVIKAIQGAL